MGPTKVTLWRPHSVPDGAAWPRGADADADGTRNWADATAASRKRNRRAPSRGDGDVVDARAAVGTACVRARAGTAPTPAGAPTRSIGNCAPPTGVVEFPEADPPDRPRRGRHGDGAVTVRMASLSLLFCAGFAPARRRTRAQLVSNVADSQLR